MSNSKLFKKLNEQIKINQLKNVAIDDEKAAIEENLIFGNLLESFNYENNLTELEETIAFSELFNILSSKNELNESLKEKYAEKLRRLLNEKPLAYMEEKGREWGKQTGVNVLNILTLGLYGKFDFPDVNYEKVDFYVDLAESDPDCHKYMNAIKAAADKNPPDKKAALEAYKNFKAAFKKLKANRKWRSRNSEYDY